MEGVYISYSASSSAFLPSNLPIFEHAQTTECLIISIYWAVTYEGAGKERLQGTVCTPRHLPPCSTSCTSEDLVPEQGVKVLRAEEPVDAVAAG